MKHFGSIASLACLTFAQFACGGDDEADPPIGVPLAAYVPPSDRIVPEAIRSSSNEEIFALGTARAGPAAPPQTGSIFRYVSGANGDDANDGSEATPWRTLQHAADRSEPGMVILVDDSAEYEGGLEITVSGRADADIVFANREVGRWPVIRGKPSKDTVVDIDASFIVFQGFDIKDHQRSARTEDTLGIQIEPRKGDISNIQILHNRVHNIGPGVVEDASCYYNGHGIIAQAEGHRISNLLIEGNELYELYVGNSECLVVNGNIDHFRVTKNFIHDVDNIAIDVIGYEKNDRETTREGIIADNVVLDASNYWPYCTRGNCTYPAGDESSDGIYVDGGADMVIEYNVVGRADHGIELQSENGQLIRNVEVRFNAVFNSNYKHFTLGDSDGSSEHDNVFFDEPALTSAELEACK